MKAAPFEYHRPATLRDAIACLDTLEDARPLAGGQSLMAMMNYRYVTPAHLVDLNRIPELAGVEERNGVLRIGAMTRQRDLLDAALLRERVPLFAEALYWVGHIQTRNRGTIGGSLAHLDPSAELPGVLAVLDATLEVHGPSGARTLSIHDWALAYMTPDLEPGELLVAIDIVPWAAGHGHGFRELARRHGDFAMAGAAALLSLDGDRVTRAALALIGVGDGPVRLREAEALLTGHEATPQRIAEAARLAADVEGIEDVHASAAYRRRIAQVMARNALTDALARARGADASSAQAGG